MAKQLKEKISGKVVLVQRNVWVTMPDERRSEYVATWNHVQISYGAVSAQAVSHPWLQQRMALFGNSPTTFPSDSHVALR